MKGDQNFNSSKAAAPGAAYLKLFKVIGLDKNNVKRIMTLKPSDYDTGEKVSTSCLTDYLVY